MASFHQRNTGGKYQGKGGLINPNPSPQKSTLTGTFRPGGGQSRSRGQRIANNAQRENDSSPVPHENQTSPPVLTHDQYQQLIVMLNNNQATLSHGNETEGGPSALLAGPFDERILVPW
ncbi:hypothetical protein Dimus_010748 [Dionaea muscipula]